MASKFRRFRDYIANEGREPNHGLEVDTQIQADYRVITGVGLRMKPGDLTTLVVRAKRLNSDTGQLEGPVYEARVGRDPTSGLEAEVGALEAQGSENILLAGLGARANPGDITTLAIWTKDITEDGTLDNLNEWRSGREPNHGLEVEITVPNPYVIVSVGLRAYPGDVTTLKGYLGYLLPV